MLTEEFITAFSKYVKDFEGEKLKIYDDGFGVPTIGTGFALINKIKNKWEAFPEDDLKKKGLNLTKKQLDIIQAYANLKTKGRNTAKLKSQLKQIKDTISPELSKNLLMSSIKDKYNHIISQIGEENWNKLNFAQQVGIMDHCFQRGNVVKLKQSLISGDYKKTAEEIRNINPALKARANLRADFVEYGVMEFSGIYIVKPGDTLSKIARINSLSLKELKEINTHLSDSKKLSVGQKIKISLSQVIPSVVSDDDRNTIFRFEIVHRNKQNDHTADKIEINTGAFFVRLETKNFTTNIGQISKNFDESSDQKYKMFHLKDDQLTDNSGYRKIFTLTEDKYNKVIEYLASGIKYGDVKELQHDTNVEQEKNVEDYYVVKDDNISLIQDLYHATGLPLYFTAAYSKDDLNKLQSEDARKALEVYGCRENIGEKLHFNDAESKEEVSDALNIDQKHIETTSNIWSCFSSGNTEYRIKVDKVLLDSINSIVSSNSAPNIVNNVSEVINMNEVLDQLFLQFKLPPGNKNVKNDEITNDNHKFMKLKKSIEEELTKNKNKLEKLLIGLENQTLPSGGHFTKEELISIYEKKIAELQAKFMTNWKVFQNNPSGYLYQPGDKLPGSADFDKEQQKLSLWLSEELSKISGGSGNQSDSNEKNLQMKEKIIKEWNIEIDILRKKPEFNDKLNESLDNVHATIVTISQDMTNFFKKNF